MTNEEILREALENICKHIETIAGDMTRHSGTYAIAKAALKATEPPMPKRADGWTECIHCGHRHAPNGSCDPLETWPCPTSKVIREVKL